MDQHTCETALRRASRKLAHAVAQHATAQSERASARHARRIRNAKRQRADALWTLDRVAYAMEGADA